jgi:hypothetical protein
MKMFSKTINRTAVLQMVILFPVCLDKSGGQPSASTSSVLYVLIGGTCYQMKGSAKGVVLFRMLINAVRVLDFQLLRAVKCRGRSTGVTAFLEGFATLHTP